MEKRVSPQHAQIAREFFRGGKRKDPESMGITDKEKGRLRNAISLKIFLAAKKEDFRGIESDGSKFLESCSNSLKINGSERLNHEYFIVSSIEQAMDSLGRLNDVRSLPSDIQELVILIAQLREKGKGIPEVLKLTCDHFKFKIPPQYQNTRKK